MIESNKYMVITNCHPNEQVAKLTGISAINALNDFNINPRKVKMPFAWKWRGEIQSWFNIFAQEQGLVDREKRETAIAKAAYPESIVLTFHDGADQKALRSCLQMEEVFIPGLIADFRNQRGYLAVELGTQQRLTRNIKRLQLALLSAIRGNYRAAHIIGFESKPSHPRNRFFVTSEFAREIIQTVSDIEEGKKPRAMLYDNIPIYLIDSKK